MFYVLIEYHDLLYGDCYKFKIASGNFILQDTIQSLLLTNYLKFYVCRKKIVIKSVMIIFSE